MNIKSHYLKNKKKWTAYTTIGGMDYNELGDTEQEAREKLAKRIAESDFILKDVKIPPIA